MCILSQGVILIQTGRFTSVLNSRVEHRCAPVGIWGCHLALAQSRLLPILGCAHFGIGRSCEHPPTGGSLAGSGNPPAADEHRGLAREVWRQAQQTILLGSARILQESANQVPELPERTPVVREAHLASLWPPGLPKAPPLRLSQRWRMPSSRFLRTLPPCRQAYKRKLCSAPPQYCSSTTKRKSAAYWRRQGAHWAP